LVGVEVGVEVGSGSMERDEVYKGKEEKLILASLSDLYSKLVKISIGTSRLSTGLTSHYLLTTYLLSS